MLSKFLISTAMVVLVTHGATAAYTVSAGKVKSIDSEAKSFVLTDSTDKDFTFRIGDKLVVNRAGKEGKSDLKPGDPIHVCYEKGTLTWTAHYILIQEGATKTCELIRGTIKSCDTDQKELNFTNESKKDTTYAVGDATVKVNMEDAKLDAVRIGDQTLLIVDNQQGKMILRSIMVNRDK